MPDGKIVKMGERVQVQHDCKLWVSFGKNRFETKWKARALQWSVLIGRLSESRRTPEIYKEYMKMTVAEQANVKDVGGFVGGTLENGRRKSNTVKTRSLITLDLDFAPVDFYEDYKALADYASACYSTHKHSHDNPRLRLVIPMSRAVDPDEYEAVSRMLADEIGIEYMDPTTFQPSRLMYWPSHSDDGDVFFDYIDAPILDPDTLLAKYPNGNWKDASLWPVSARELEARTHRGDKIADPTTKKGTVGAFCRAYDVPAAIDAYLSDIYTPTDKPDRYTYAFGSTAAGLVIYEHGLFAYSNHGTDPAGGIECNAFDLVRIHLFGSQDDSVRSDTKVTNLPSYKAMKEFALQDEKVLRIMDADQHPVTANDFDDEELTPADVRLKLVRSSKGVIEKSVVNAERIFAIDPGLQGLQLNLLSGRIEISEERPVPWERRAGAWTDTDDAQLYTYLSREYAEFARQTVFDQKIMAAERGAFHPIKQYLEDLPEWDGVPRAETLLIDYLGAEDDVYVREASMKTLMAAVRRIYEPGIKFDSMLILSGPPASGKSTLIAKLGGEWFSDNLNFDDMTDKTAAEKLQGYWILEISEMKGMRRMDVETIKSFLSRQEDVYRAAYGRNTESHKRQSILFGTVNDLAGYLKDATGNRRFWPVEITGNGEKKSWDMSDVERDQIWAEVMYQYKHGRKSLLLGEEAAKIAAQRQQEAMETDAREGFVEQYLQTPIPRERWGKMSISERCEYFRNLEDEDFLPDESTEVKALRDNVSVAEVWCECFGNRLERLDRKDSLDIASMLKHLGWEKGGRLMGGAYGQRRVFLRPD